MTSIIGLNFYGDNLSYFQSPTSAIRGIESVEVSNAIIDDLSIRERTDIEITQARDEWELDHRLLALFNGDLEAGNIRNNGIKIEQFAIKRRKLNDIQDITLAYREFENDKQFEYTDYTQANDEFIYSIIPVGENNLEGLPNSVQIESDFTGWYLVDKDNDEVVAFDKSLDSVEEVQTELIQGRTEVPTMSRFPNVFYDSTSYHSLSLSTVIIPSEWERSGYNYQRFLNTFIHVHKPFILKSGNGEIYVCDISNPVKSSPKNTWNGYDYFTLTIDAIETNDYLEFMSHPRE